MSFAGAVVGPSLLMKRIVHSGLSVLLPDGPIRLRPQVFRHSSGAICAVLLILAASGCALARRPFQRRNGEEVRQLTEHAVAAREKGELEAAARYLHKAIAKDPDDFQARCQMAEVDWEQGREEAAIKELKTAREINPDSAAVHLRLGEVELGRHRFRQALGHLEEALELNPKNPTVYCLRGEAFEALKRTDEALASYYRGLEFDPRNSQALLGVSRIQLAAGKPRRSLAKLRTVLAGGAKPEDRKQAFSLLGTAHLRLKHWAEAATALEQLIAEAGGSTDDYYRLAYAQLNAGETDKARQNLREVLVRDAKHAGARALRDRLAKSGPGPVASTNKRRVLQQ